MSIFLKSIKAKEVINFSKEQQKNIIDVRENSEFKQGHMPNARNITMQKLLSNTSAFIKPEQEYFIVCASGMRSRSVCRQLKKQGITNVTNVKGGYFGYERSKVN